MAKVISMKKFVDEKNGLDVTDGEFIQSVTYEKVLIANLLLARSRFNNALKFMGEHGVHSFEQMNHLSSLCKDKDMIEAEAERYMKFGLVDATYEREFPFTSV